jgi:hypothetical protein
VDSSTVLGTCDAKHDIPNSKIEQAEYRYYVDPTTVAESTERGVTGAPNHESNLIYKPS